MKKRVFTLTTEDAVIEGNNDQVHRLVDEEGRVLATGRLVGPFEDLSWQVMISKEQCLNSGLTPALGMKAFAQAMTAWDERTEWGDFQIAVRL